MLERRPWLPFAALVLLAALFSLVAAYERDWWVLKNPPQSHRPSQAPVPLRTQYAP